MKFFEKFRKKKEQPQDKAQQNSPLNSEFFLHLNFSHLSESILLVMVAHPRQTGNEFLRIFASPVTIFFFFKLLFIF